MNKIFYYKSPIGMLKLTFSKGILIGLTKEPQKVAHSLPIEDFAKKVFVELDEYFSGKRKIFTVPFAFCGTEFQNKVWNALCKIPYGKTVCYADIAAMIETPDAYRAVGNACNKNPIILIVPCHRVISKNKKLGGFAYGQGTKKKLLKLESRWR